MAKDDYEVIVYRVLVYLYACMKRKIMYEEISFREAVRKNVESDEYFAKVISMMKSEGLITKVSIVEAWGGDCIIASDLRDMEITAEGIRYLKENSTMNKVGAMLKESVDTIARLAVIVGLIV